MTELIWCRQLVLNISMFVAVSVLTCTTSSPGQSATSKPEASQSSVAAADLPKYTVATVKPGTDDGHFSFQLMPDGVSIAGVTMQMILREAFHTDDDRIVGSPGWVKSRKFDIQAKVDAADAPKLDHLNPDQRRSMLVPLLVERFNLKYHHETRELPMYSLVIAKGGVKMKESKPDDPSDNEGSGQHFLRFKGRGHLESKGTNVPMLVSTLSMQLGRSVVDKTGLSGGYDFTLQWTPDDAAPSADDAVGPSLFTALQEQLGLKLESDKALAEVIVIDHLDMPSPN